MNDPASRRDRLAKHLRPATFAIAAAAVASTLAAPARFGEPFSPVLEHVKITSGGSSRRNSFLRAGFVTDTHVGPTIRAADVDKAMALLADASPELLLFGGDFICESPRYIPEITAVLRNYASLPCLGAIAVFGNHDHANDAVRLQVALERIGIRVLRNEGITITAHESQFWFAGIDDAVLGRPRLEPAFADQPSGSTAIALWHEPDWASQTAALGAKLQLSGHSHGGQVRLPLVGHVAAPFGGRKFTAGLNHVFGMPIYTSRGVGTYRPPVRFRCRPEVTLIEIPDANNNEELAHDAGNGLRSAALKCEANRKLERASRG